jgi:hypothetical protein
LDNILIDGYKDLGEIGKSDNLAGGSSFITPWINGCQNVKELLFLIRNDQDINVEIQKKDTNGNETSFNPAFVMAINPSCKDMMYGNLFGYSIRFRITNTTGVIANDISINLQLFGN